MTTTVVSTGSRVAREACLHALKEAASRAVPAADLTGELAAAWWTGTRSVHNLARATGCGPDDVRDALRGAGIEPGPAASTERALRYEPLDAGEVRALAEVVGRIAERPMLATEPEPHALLLWHLHAALLRLATVLDSGEQTERKDTARDLVARLRVALAEAQEIMAGLYDRAALAALALDEAEAAAELEGQAVAEGAVLTLGLPAGHSITATISWHPYARPDAGYTTIAGSSDLLDTTRAVDGDEHLRLRHALDTIARVLSDRLDETARAYE
ncbi:hypothetical protein [Kitasatospora sp. NPDC098663]|uniref:hypothetical protein n=1 Tax=Kitasatospora sp. NPDC098663 TaxID=3364096 RepID=UPI0038001805